MDRRTIVSLGLGALSVACAVGVFDRGLPNAQVTVEPLAEGEGDAEGVFRFRRLPPGKYTVQVLSGQAQAKQSFELSPGGRVRVGFWLPRHREFIVT